MWLLGGREIPEFITVLPGNPGLCGPSLDGVTIAVQYRNDAGHYDYGYGANSSNYDDGYGPTATATAATMTTSGKKPSPCPPARHCRWLHFREGRQWSATAGKELSS